jgi:hypothetical protein
VLALEPALLALARGGVVEAKRVVDQRVALLLVADEGILGVAPARLRHGPTSP